VGDTAEKPEGGRHSRGAEQKTAHSRFRGTTHSGGGPRWRRPAADAARQRRLQGQARGGGVAAAEGRTQQFHGEMRENNGLEAHRLAFD